MSMSHVYQPVMIRELLRSGGTAPTEVIARALLNEDRSQLEYYEQITKNMPGKVLRDHGIVSYDKTTCAYSLSSFGELTQPEIAELIRACEDKLRAYIDRRGDAI